MIQLAARRGRAGTRARLRNPGRWRPRGRSALVLAAAAVVVAACSSSTKAASTASSATSSVPPATAAGAGAGAGCGARPASTTTLHLSAGGRTRLVIVHQPARSAGAARAALVLNLHGSGSTAAEQMAFTGMNATADADGFVVAYPQGAIASGTGFDWNVPGQPLVGGKPVPAGAADDVAFLSSAISQLEARDCIDSHRIDVTGFSGGARTTSQLGCDLSGTVAAIAPVSGLRLPEPCPGVRPVPVISFHGTADPVDPYAGKGQAYWTYSVPEAASRWAAHDGCSATPAVTTPVAGATLSTYGGCGQGASVELYTLAGAGHTWPGGPPLPASLTKELGPQFTGLSANDLMWAFFQAHPRP